MRQNKADRLADARLEIQKDHANLEKALAVRLSAGNAVAWAEEVESALSWIEVDTRKLLGLVRADARERVALVLLPGGS